jgi:hypothetical protein
MRLMPYRVRRQNGHGLGSILPSPKNKDRLNDIRMNNSYETDMARPFRIAAGEAKILIDPFLSDKSLLRRAVGGCER